MCVWYGVCGVLCVFVCVYGVCVYGVCAAFRLTDDRYHAQHCGREGFNRA